MNELLRRILFLPPQSSTMAREIDYLHYTVIGVTIQNPQVAVDKSDVQVQLGADDKSLRQLLATVPQLLGS